MEQRYDKSVAVADKTVVAARRARLAAVAESPSAASPRPGTPPRASDAALMSEPSALRGDGDRPINSANEKSHEHGPQQTQELEYEAYLEAEEDKLRAYQREEDDFLDLATAGAGAVLSAIENGMTDPWDS